MSRIAGPRKTTVSICVTNPEHLTIGGAARMSMSSVSLWGYNAIMRTLMTKESRAAVLRDYKAMPKGHRGRRVSIVMNLPDHMQVVATSRMLGITPHSYCQAVLIFASERQMQADPARAAEVEGERKVERAMKALLSVRMTVQQSAYAPRDTAREVEKMMAGMLPVFHTKGGAFLKPSIEKALLKYAEPGSLDPAVDVEISIDPDMLRGVAICLDMKPRDVLRAMTMRHLEKHSIKPGDIAPALVTTLPSTPGFLVSERTVRDNRGNVAKISTWGTVDAAKEALASLKDCYNCKDCSNCHDCHGCVRCRDCKACHECKDCRVCKGCTGCTDCAGCTDCKACTSCARCFDSLNSTGCENCIFIDGAVNVENVQNTMVAAGES